MRASSILMLAAVPATLALGASYWLLFAENTHTFSRQLNRESRDALAVHASPEPKAKIKIVARSSYLRVEDADQYGSRLVAYIRNTGHTCVPYVMFHFKMLAPDGTVIASNSEYQDDTSGGLSPGQRIQMSFDDVSEDNRAVSIEVWASGAPELSCE